MRNHPEMGEGFGMSLKKALAVLVIVGVMATVVAAGGFSYPALGITLCGAIVLAGMALGKFK